MQQLKKIIYKLPKLYFGFILASLGLAFMIEAGVGMSPWGTLQVGLEGVSGISYGRITQLVGLTIIVSTMFMKVYPGVGTVLNIAFIGYFIDLIRSIGIIPNVSGVLAQLTLCISGLIVFSFGIYFYLSCGLGAGPRDGLMLALIKITGKPPTVIKPAIELTVLGIGILIGGPVGIGTIIVALLGGRMLDMVFTMFKFDPKAQKQQNLAEFVLSFRSN